MCLRWCSPRGVRPSLESGEDAFDGGVEFAGASRGVEQCSGEWVAAGLTRQKIFSSPGISSFSWFIRVTTAAVLDVAQLVTFMAA